MLTVYCERVRPLGSATLLPNRFNGQPYDITLADVARRIAIEALAAHDRSRTFGTANLVWSPVRDVDLGPELVHARVDAGTDAADLLNTTSRARGASGVIFRMESRFGSWRRLLPPS